MSGVLFKNFTLCYVTMGQAFANAVFQCLKVCFTEVRSLTKWSVCWMRNENVRVRFVHLFLHRIKIPFFVSHGFSSLLALVL